MSGCGSLTAGLGMGAAQTYYQKKNEDAENDFQNKRDEALASGGKIPMPKRAKRERPIDAIVGKIKGAFSDKGAAAPAASTPSVAPAAEVAPLAALSPVASALPEVDTDAFNDDATVPNEPEQFKNSYA